MAHVSIAKVITDAHYTFIHVTHLTTQRGKNRASPVVSYVNYKPVLLLASLLSFSTDETLGGITSARLKDAGEQ